MNTEIERRRYRRAPLTFPVVVNGATGPIKGKTGNLSFSGALILLPEKTIGIDEFQFTIEILESFGILVTCKKHWEGKLAIDKAVYHGFGVQFTKIHNNDDQQFISTLVEEYLIN